MVGVLIIVIIIIITGAVPIQASNLKHSLKWTFKLAISGTHLAGCYCVFRNNHFTQPWVIQSECNKLCARNSSLKWILGRGCVEGMRELVYFILLILLLWVWCVEHGRKVQSDDDDDAVVLADWWRCFEFPVSNDSSKCAVCSRLL